MITANDRSIYLASRSPRRRELLAQIGVKFHLLLFRDLPMADPEVNEDTIPGETPHDYVVRDVLGTSVLLTRDATGEAHAFLNYCRHRGARPAAGCGSARRFTCPYHAWTYDSRGTLVGLPGAEGFDELDRSEHGLVELPSQERHGFVWVVLTAGAAN